jgi:hypothetical protein
MKNEKLKKERKIEQEPFVSFPVAFSVRTWAEKYIDLSERTLWQDIKTGQLAVVERGRRRLITAEAMNNYLRKHTKGDFDAQADASKILSGGVVAPQG